MHRLSPVKQIFYLIFILCICYSPIDGQSFAINYTAKDGLESENINTIAEDQNGYIYVGSAIGIMKFDGVEFIPFTKSATGNIPKNVFVYKLIFDDENNLWVYSELNGIYHWDRKTDHWTNFSYSSEPLYKIQSNEVVGIATIDSFFYFSCRGHGLNSINIHDLTLNKNIDNSTNSYSDFDQVGDKLLLNGHKELYFFKNGILNSISKTNSSSFVDTEIYKGEIFLTKYHSGLFLSTNGNIKSLGLDKITDPWKTRILGIRDDEIIVTSQNSGLLKYNLIDKEWKLITAKPYNSNSLIKAKYKGGLIDSRGIIWVATTKGISCFNPNLQGFVNLDNADNNIDYLIDAKFHKKSRNYITTYASSGDKVKIFDENLILKNSYNHTPDVNSIRSIFDVVEFEDEIFAVSHRLYKIDPNTGKCSFPQNQYLKSLTNIYTVKIDDNGYLWCIHDQNQLLVYNLNTQEVITEKELPYFPDPSSKRHVNSEIQFDDQYTLIASKSLFFTISKGDYKIQAYVIENGKLKPINSRPSKKNRINKVFSFEDHVYISSRNDGIFKTQYDKSNSSFIVLNHLSAQELYSPTDFDFDDLGNIWVTSDNGLSLLDDDLRIIKKFNSQDGLTNTKLSTGLFIENNKIFLDGESGIIVGDPSLLSLESSPINVDIPKFEVNGKGYHPLSNNLNFPYTKNNINVKISIPIYGNKSEYNYHYRLKGSSNKWKSSSIDKNEISYENLNPGSYTFEVKSAVGSNESQVSKIEFKIQPPFWETSYFILLVLGLISLLLALIYKNRIKKNTEKERINTLLSQLENTAIRSQLNPHFIFNSLNSIRSMILLDRKNDSIHYLEQFSDMVREVLQMSKEEKVTLAHEISFNKNYLEIEKLRFSDKFKYYFNIEKDLEIDKIKVPPLIIQPFVENAIWHGLLHNDKESILNIDISTNEKSLHIMIDDNGIGREKSKERQQSSIKKTKRNLGVSLSRKRISMLGKNATVEIIDKVENNNPMGTTVHITIPLIYEK